MITIISALKRVTLLFAFFSMLFFAPGKQAFGQLGDIGNIMEAGKDGLDDAQLLVEEYLKPFGSGFGAGLNSGWVDRANTHGLLGFQVRFNISTAFVPDIDKEFDLNALDLKFLQFDENNSFTPTFSGSSDPGTRLFYEDEITGTRLVDFNMPPGVGAQYIPTPMIQASAGLPKNTDVMIRFIPKMEIGDYGSLYLYGAGIKHELNQWIPGGWLLPVTFSVMGGYTAFKSSVSLSVEPKGQFSYPDPQNPISWEDQEFALTTDAFTVNLLVGRSLPIISVYGGVGFEASTSSVTLKGNYPYYVLSTDNPGQREVNALEDPIDLSFDGYNTLRALAGVRISPLPFVAINADFTYADYSIVSVGVSVGMR